jgi:hypothetical protein
MVVLFFVVVPLAGGAVFEEKYIKNISDSLRDRSRFCCSVFRKNRINT